MRLAVVALLAFAFQAADRVPRAMVRMEHYSAVKHVLRDGDILYAFVIRWPDPSDPRSPRPGGPPEPPKDPKDFPRTIFDPARLEKALSALNAIDDPRVRKCLILSSVQDLKDNLARLPKDLKWVGYNTEPGMTPSEEMVDIEASVREFAAVAHKAGLKVAWAPTNVMITADEKKYLGLARYVDTVALQHQRVLENEGVDAFVQRTLERSDKLRKINPSVAVAVQVVVGRGTNEQAIEALRRSAASIDEISVWTMKDFESEAKIIQGVRGAGK